MNVHQAYSQSIQEIFGADALHFYQQKGGLKNRANSEVVSDLLQYDPSLSIRTKRYLETHGQQLGRFIPLRKKISLEWNERNPAKVLGELLVCRRLSLLLECIGETFADGTPWPRPCEGFTSFWTKIQQLKEQGGSIDTALISSGHISFIEKTFEVWGLSMPDILITDDDIRGLNVPTEMERRVKPGLLPFALAHQSWLRKRGLLGENFSVYRATVERDRIVYLGDDVKKDGGMAMGAHVKFGHFNSTKTDIHLLDNGNFTFSDWSTLTPFIEETFTSPEGGSLLWKERR